MDKNDLFVRLSDKEIPYSRIKIRKRLKIQKWFSVGHVHTLGRFHNQTSQCTIFCSRYQRFDFLRPHVLLHSSYQAIADGMALKSINYNIVVGKLWILGSHFHDD